MFDSLKSDVEPPWAGRIWYGSVFGAYSLLGATGVFLGLVKHGRFQIFLDAYWLAVLAFATHSLWLAFTQHPPTKDLSSRIRLMTVLAVAAPALVGLLSH
jgi:hypothetical protein